MALEAPPDALLRDTLTRALILAFLQRALSLPFAGTERITSWYRSPERNLEVGGARASQHILGLALDLIVDPGRRAPLAEAARGAGLVPVTYPEPDRLHVQLFPAGFLASNGLDPLQAHRRLVRKL